MTEEIEQAWLVVLRKQVAISSQKVVGDAIGYSNAVVSGVLKGSYKGDLKRVEHAVKGAYMSHVVDCPILGEIPNHICLGYQKKKFSCVNPMLVQLYRACRGGCEHSDL